MFGVKGRVQQTHTGQFFCLDVLLEKQLARHTRRRPHQRHRPALQVRQHQVCHGGVMLHDIEFGQPAAVVDHTVSMCHAQ